MTLLLIFFISASGTRENNNITPRQYEGNIVQRKWLFTQSIWRHKDRLWLLFVFSACDLFIFWQARFTIYANPLEEREKLRKEKREKSEGVLIQFWLQQSRELQPPKPRRWESEQPTSLERISTQIARQHYTFINRTNKEATLVH
jgi:hypothetical protein